MIDLIDFDKLPAGHNASIAVMSFSGYDIEVEAFRCREIGVYLLLGCSGVEQSVRRSRSANT